MWVTMGLIADRTDDKLGASDLAVVEFRRQMLDAVRAFRDGQPAIGTDADRITPDVCAFQAIVPKATDWRVFEVDPVLDEAGRVALDTNYQTTN